jgi:hypothetical protein
MLTPRAIEILAKYQILERNLDRVEKVQAFRDTVKSTEFVPATKRTRLLGAQGR